MADSLRIPATKAPTFFNRTTLAGLGLGLALPIPLSLALIPAVIGAYLGHSEMSDAVANGKTVEKPGLFKKEAVKDGFIAAGIGGLIQIGLAAGALFLVPTMPAVATALAAISLAAPVLGFFAGAFQGKSRMATEWAQAESYVLDRGEYRSPSQSRSRERGQSPEPQVSYKNSVSAAEEQELQERMGRNQKDFAALRLEEKANAAEVEAAR